jgi:NAD(P)-dependent dehydrogenase (short-subunit alcohol dehydrogenase family)
MLETSLSSTAVEVNCGPSSTGFEHQLRAPASGTGVIWISTSNDRKKMDLGLAGSVVLIVGGSGYIGTEVARQFASEGARVVIAGRDPARLDAAAAKVGSGVSTRVLDSSSDESVASAIGWIVNELGRLDVVVDCAAPSARTLDPGRDADPGQVLQAMEGKPLGYLRVANAALPVMIAAGSGRIVFVSGQNALITGSVTGSVRNGAVIAISKNLADAYAGTGVTVNTVNPGTVTDQPNPVPTLGKPGESTPAQVAALVVFLASAVAAGVSGESIAVGHRVLGVIGS